MVYIMSFISVHGFLCVNAFTPVCMQQAAIMIIKSALTIKKQSYSLHLHAILIALERCKLSTN